MERTLSAEESMLRQVAEALDALVDQIVEHWAERMERTIYAARRRLDRRDLIDRAPELLRGVAEAVRRGETEVLEARWTAAARAHALERRREGMELGDLLREYQLLREECWRALREQLAGMRADEVWSVAGALDAALDTMGTISTSTYGSELQQALEEAEAGRRSAAQLAAIVDYAQEAIGRVNLEGIVEHWNRGAERLYGYRADEIIGKPIRMLIPPERLPEATDSLARIRRGESVPRYETTRVRKDGSRVDISLNVSPIFDAQGNAVGASWVAHDIGAEVRLRAERERLLDELQAERARLQALLEQMPSGVIVAAAPSGRMLLGNEQAARIWGRPLPEAASVAEYRAFRGLHPDGRPYEPEEWPVARALRGEVVSNEEIRIVRSNGTQSVTLQSAAPIYDEEGRTTAAVSVLTDISERKRASQEREHLLEEVRRRAAELSATIASIRDGLVIYGPQGEIARMNRAAEKLLGLTQSEYIAMRPQERKRVLRVEGVGGRPLAPDETSSARALRGEVVVGEHETIHRRDGSTRELLASAGPILDEQGHILGAVRSLSDVTDIVELQKEREDILRAVSHDLRNPLAAVLGQAQLCERRLAKAGLERERASAASITASAQRMNTMIQDLVDAARSESGQLQLERQPIDLHAFALDLKGRLASTLEVARVTVDVPEGLPPVSADTARLERILTNLLSNALKYSGPGTPVTVDARREGSMVITWVTDRGRGIAPEDLPHLFKRYFRARGGQPAGEGLGLGLYVTRKLVEAHGGSIWVESVVGQGSTFYFSLPIAQA